MATSWLKARTPLLASRLFLGCAFTGTESSDMSDSCLQPRRRALSAGLLRLCDLNTERRQAPSLPAFFHTELCDSRRVFLLHAAVLATVAFKMSRRRNPARRIVRRLKVCGFRVVNHARSIAELISVPLTDDHLDV